MLRRYLEFIVRYRISVIVLTLGISLVLASQISRLTVIVNPDHNLPQDHPYVMTTNTIERIFGGRNLIIVGIEPLSGDVYQPAVLETIQRITDGILEIPGVIRSNVISLAARKAKNITGTEEGMVVRQLMETVPRTPEAVERLRHAVSANPIYLDSIVSKSGRMAVVIADFKFGPELQGYRAIKERVEAVLARERHDHVRLYLGGIAAGLAWLEIYSQRMGLFFFIALAVIMAVLYLSFRSFQGMIVPVTTAILSVLCGLGIMGTLRVPLDTFNATTPILIMAVAAGHSVQILKRFYEEYARLHDSKAAVVESLAKVGPVMLTAGSIAVVSFLALTTFPTLTIRIFGIFTATGIASAVLLEMTFIPALRSWIAAPKRYEVERERQVDVLDRFTGWIVAQLAGAYWGRLFAIPGVLFVVLGVGIHRLVIDASLKGEFAPTSPVRLDDRALNEGMGGTNTLFLLIEGPGPDAMKEPAALRAIEATQRYVESRYALVGKTQSLADFLKRMNKAMHADDPAFDVVPDQRDLIAQYLFLYSMSGDPGDFDSYVDYEYRTSVLWAYLKTDSTDYIETIIRDLKDWTIHHFPEGYRVSIGGGMAQGAALNQVMVEGKLLNIGVVAASVYAISSLVLYSPLAGLFVLIPLALTVLVNFGMMGLLGIRLDIGTSAVSGMAVGIGADYAIYIIYRLREEVRRHGDLLQALRITLPTAGKAILYVALAVGAGYAMLMLNLDFRLHVRLGLLVALAMATSSLAAVVLVPATVARLKPNFILAQRRASPAPSMTDRQAGQDFAG